MSADTMNLWGDEATPISLDSLIIDSESNSAEAIPLGDRAGGARQQQTALEAKIDQLKSRAEIKKTAKFRNMQVQKAVARNANPTMLSLFRIDVIVQAVLSPEQAETFLEGVETLLEDQEVELDAWERTLDNHIRQNLTPAQLREYPMSYSNPVAVSMTISCQQSMRILRMLEKLDSIAVKTALLEIHCVTMPTASKRDLRKVIGNMVRTMRSLIDLEKRASRMSSSDTRGAQKLQVVTESLGLETVNEPPADDIEPPPLSPADRRRAQDQIVLNQTLTDSAPTTDSTDSTTSVEADSTS